MGRYSAEQLNFLRQKAGYIWWLTPEEALESPDRLIAQLMDIGTTEDTARLETLFSKEELATVLHAAVPGQFNPRSWSFWHYRLEVIRPSDPVPDMPLRRIGPTEFVPREVTDAYPSGPDRRGR